MVLTAAANITTGRRAVAYLLRTVGALAPGHDASYRRVLSTARWSGLALDSAFARNSRRLSAWLSRRRVGPHGTATGARPARPAPDRSCSSGSNYACRAKCNAADKSINDHTATHGLTDVAKPYRCLRSYGLHHAFGTEDQGTTDCHNKHHAP